MSGDLGETEWGGLYWLAMILVLALVFIAFDTTRPAKRPPAREPISPLDQDSKSLQGPYKD